MLDIETRRRIDTARDILVGKVPDPKSQVEQITIALIYKFMADMDAEAEELGGRRTFFAGEFARYGWAQLMAPALSGQDTLNRYSEAIQRMPENPGIPALFRDIFKNAYLPYRDPETLRAFLKVIDGFSYDHSERLGDAFEYLLSVLGSQGDAGQFRTPRHIIDFMVAIVDPRKDERILDPACGTAGFLISAYKHILAANSSGQGDRSGTGGSGTGGSQTRPYATMRGDRLSPDERKRLMDNVRGYDISPDMVRLSLVNLYLHGFNDPHVAEYDALTSEERWNEHYHVILANPPFMSPKGGIRPHKRFSVQSNRSEVLFVDYIAEHLAPGGRAAIIVPEGVIFQSGKAYKQLRKLLVEEYLAGVISLPAGVFNPYSGVKTSILWLDKTLARQSDSILFVKIEADGFDLGAQRKEIKRSDLPQALQGISDYKSNLTTLKQFHVEAYPCLNLIPREKVAENGDYILSGDRYILATARSAAAQLVAIGSLCRRIAESVDPQMLQGPITYVGLENISQHTGELIGDTVVNAPTAIKSAKTKFHKGQILYGKLRPNLNKVWFSDREGICSTDIFVLDRLFDSLNLRFVTYMLRSHEFNEIVTANLRGAQLPRVSWIDFSALQIPVPPLQEQEALVAEVESYQRIIDGARQVVANWRPRIDVDPEWPVVELGEVCDFKRGPFGGSLKKEIFVEKGYAVYEQSHAIGDQFKSVRYFISNDKFEEMRQFEVRPGDLIMSCSGTMGRTAIVPKNVRPGIINQALLRLTPRETVDGRFLKLWMESDDFQQALRSKAAGAAIENVASVSVLKSLHIPLPSLELQTGVIHEAEHEAMLIQANRDLIARYEQKIKARLARVWGEGS